MRPRIDVSVALQNYIGSKPVESMVTETITNEEAYPRAPQHNRLGMPA